MNNQNQLVFFNGRKRNVLFNNALYAFCLVTRHQSNVVMDDSKRNNKISFICSIHRHMRWVVGSILHGVNPLSYFSFQTVLYDWCNKDWYVLSCLWDDVYKRTLAANRKYGSSGFHFSLSEWSFTICQTPYKMW